MTEEELLAKGVDIRSLLSTGAAKETRVDLGKLLPSEAAKPLLEKEFMAEVMSLARRHCWKVFHDYDSRKSEAGFPDLVMVREFTVWAELKREGEKPTADQLDWLEALQLAGEKRVFCWWPKDWPEIIALLTAPVIPRKPCEP